MAAFEFINAQELGKILNQHHVRYLFFGKSGAILLGFSDTTQDVDLYVEKENENCGRLVAALLELGFRLTDQEQDEIRRGKDFVQLRNGPFDVDMVFAPAGIESFGDAWRRRLERHGTTTLFAALNTLDGRIVDQCIDRHTHREWLRFLKRVDAPIPAEKTLHVIADNYATHQHPKVLRGLRRHPRVQMHFTPTSASWLNMIERFFRDLSSQRIRHGVSRGNESMLFPCSPGGATYIVPERSARQKCHECPLVENMTQTSRFEGLRHSLPPL